MGLYNMQINTASQTEIRSAMRVIQSVILALLTTGCAGTSRSDVPRMFTPSPCPDLSGKYEASGPFRLTINGKVVDKTANNGIAKLIYSLPATKDNPRSANVPLLKKIGGEGNVKYIGIDKMLDFSYRVTLFTSDNKANGTYISNIPDSAICHDGMYHWSWQESPISAPDIIPSTKYEARQEELYVDSAGSLISVTIANRNVLALFAVPVQSEGIVNVATFARVRSDGKGSNHE